MRDAGGHTKERNVESRAGQRESRACGTYTVAGLLDCRLTGLRDLLTLSGEWNQSRSVDLRSRMFRVGIGRCGSPDPEGVAELAGARDSSEGATADSGRLEIDAGFAALVLRSALQQGFHSVESE